MREYADVITWAALVGKFSLYGKASSIEQAKAIAYTAGCKLEELVGSFVAGPWKYFILIDMAPGQDISGQLVLKLEVPWEVYKLAEDQLES